MPLSGKIGLISESGQLAEVYGDFRRFPCPLPEAMEDGRDRTSPEPGQRVANRNSARCREARGGPEEYAISPGSSAAPGRGAVNTRSAARRSSRSAREAPTPWLTSNCCAARVTAQKARNAPAKP